MAGFFGAKCDPVKGERLGSRFRVYATLEERLARARDEHERWVAEDLATRAAALRAAGERPGREAGSLAADVEAARERWEKTEQKIVRAGERNGLTLKAATDQVRHVGTPWAFVVGVAVGPDGSPWVMNSAQLI